MRNPAFRSVAPDATFTVGKFTWDGGCLQLLMVGTSTDGRPSPRNPMKNIKDACRWSSRQAARQFKRRNQGNGLAGSGWRVIDLRRFSMPAV